MSILDDFGDMLGTTLIVANPSTEARSIFGHQEYDGHFLYFKAHVLEGDGSNRKLSGVDEHVSIIAWIASTSTSDITRDSVIVLPDLTTPPLKAVSYPRDEDGKVHHTKVVFG